jgi:hypothetical protein
MKLLSTTEAAKIKGVTRQALIKAIDRGDIDGERTGPRTMVVINNKKFTSWMPNRKMVEAQKKARNSSH